MADLKEMINNRVDLILESFTQMNVSDDSVSTSGTCSSATISISTPNSNSAPVHSVQSPQIKELSPTIAITLSNIIQVLGLTQDMQELVSDHREKIKKEEEQSHLKLKRLREEVQAEELRNAEIRKKREGLFNATQSGMTNSSISHGLPLMMGHNNSIVQPILNSNSNNTNFNYSNPSGSTCVTSKSFNDQPDSNIFTENTSMPASNLINLQPLNQLNLLAQSVINGQNNRGCEVKRQKMGYASSSLEEK